MKISPSRLSISNRVVVSLVSVVAIISGLFAASIYVSIHVVEETLVTREMSMYLRVERRQPGPLEVNDSELEVYTEKSAPAWLDKAPYGLSELERSDRDYYVYKQQQEGAVYYLLMDQGNFEDIEMVFYYIIYILYLGCILLSWLIARRLSKSIIKPIAELDKGVSRKMEGVGDMEPLYRGSADDEVGRLAKSFDSLINQYDESLAREQLFNADVSHELKTPLMVISSSIELLEEVSEHSAFETRHFQNIKQSCAEIDELSTTFLMLLKNNYDDSAERTDISLQLVIEQLDKKWRPLIERKGLRFMMTDHGSLGGTVPGGTTMILLNNLIKNALNYTLKGSVAVDFYATRWVVSDTGVGIGDIDDGQLYRSFAQDNNKGRTEGYGLGLSISRRICDLYDWQLDYQRNAEGGTSFTVQIN